MAHNYGYLLIRTSFGVNAANHPAMKRPALYQTMKIQSPIRQSTQKPAAPKNQPSQKQNMINTKHDSTLHAPAPPNKKNKAKSPSTEAPDMAMEKRPGTDSTG